MKHRGFTLWEILAVLLLVVVAAVVLFAVFMKPRESGYKGPYIGCQINLKQIGLGLVQYAQDYDEIYPPVSLSDAAKADTPYGWADALQPYIKSIQVFRCPSAAGPYTADPTQHGYTDYWYNRNLAGKNRRDSNIIIAFGDGNDGHDETTARYSLSQLPEAWRDNKNSPAYRHREGANYAFADGHVKWYKPNQVANTATDGQPTFRVD